MYRLSPVVTLVDGDLLQDKTFLIVQGVARAANDHVKEQG